MISSDYKFYLGCIMKHNNDDIVNSNIGNLHYLETKLGEALMMSSDNDLKMLVIIMLIGRCKFAGSNYSVYDLMEQYSNCPIVIASSNDAKIDYIISKRYNLNNYIDTVLRFI